MYPDAFALHSAEPGHLPLGKLVDGCGKLAAHFFEAQLTQQVQRYELVFQS